MTTAIDTNVIVALWDPGAVNHGVRQALDSVRSRGSLVISAPVFAELSAHPGCTPEFLDYFLSTTAIKVDWNLSETIWRTAGHAFRSYATRRQKQGQEKPGPILADFLIGAHATEGKCTLLTFDAGI